MNYMSFLETFDQRIIFSYFSSHFTEFLIYISLFLSFLFLILTIKTAQATPGLIFFFLTLIFLPSYSNLRFFFNSSGLLKVSATFDVWLRHFSFYFGQLFFLLFIFSLISRNLEKFEKAKIKLFVFFLIFAYSFFLIFPNLVLGYHGINPLNNPSLYNFLLFFTNLGLQHILAFLFFLLTFAIIRLGPFYAGLEPLLDVAFWFFIADGSFIMIHFLEYSADNLHLLPFLFADLAETIKFSFQYLGIIFFYFGIVRFVKYQTIKTEEFLKNF